MGAVQHADGVATVGGDLSVPDAGALLRPLPARVRGRGHLQPDRARARRARPRSLAPPRRSPTRGRRSATRSSRASALGQRLGLSEGHGAQHDGRSSWRRTPAGAVRAPSTSSRPSAGTAARSTSTRTARASPSERPGSPAALEQEPGAAGDPEQHDPAEAANHGNTLAAARGMETSAERSQVSAPRADTAPERTRSTVILGGRRSLPR